MDPIEPVNCSEANNSTPFPALPEDVAAVSRTPSQPVIVQPVGRSRPSSVSSQRHPSIRISRVPSIPTVNPVRIDPTDHSAQLPPPQPLSPLAEDDEVSRNRRRSSSEPRLGRWRAPQRPALTPAQGNEASNSARPRPPPTTLPLIAERSHPNAPHAATITQDTPQEELHVPPPVLKPDGKGRLRRASAAAIPRFRGRNRSSTVSGGAGADARQVAEYDPRIVDVLDVIDPEVSTLSTLTNVQNSLFVPDLGRFLNRMPTYTLTRPDPWTDEERPSATGEEAKGPDDGTERPQALERLRPYTSVSSALPDEDPRFAILPDDESLEGWSKEDIERLNDHVRHMLHSRRSKFKRAMKGFGQYVRKPLGFLVTLYATLITLFGLAWVLFLIGWIYVGAKQLYVINIIDYTLVALFAIMGDGLIPFRAMDTYHTIFIAHYTFLTWKIRRIRGLRKLKDKNDLPSRRADELEIDPEIGDVPKEDQHEFTVLAPLQQQRLTHHQQKLSKSHTFYKPHETVTHRAFPLRMLIAVVVLLDLHSCLQVALGVTTWGIPYKDRPFALTTVILCCSITCNIAGGVLIMIGDRMTRKKDVVERMFRQQLTSEAMKKMRKKHEVEEDRYRLEHVDEVEDEEKHEINEGTSVHDMQTEKGTTEHSPDAETAAAKGGHGHGHEDGHEHSNRLDIHTNINNTPTDAPPSTTMNDEKKTEMTQNVDSQNQQPQHPSSSSSRPPPVLLVPAVAAPTASDKEGEKLQPGLLISRPRAVQESPRP